jgi:hypothetical protein
MLALPEQRLPLAAPEPFGALTSVRGHILLQFHGIAHRIARDAF